MHLLRSRHRPQLQLDINQTLTREQKITVAKRFEWTFTSRSGISGIGLRGRIPSRELVDSTYACGSLIALTVLGLGAGLIPSKGAVEV